MEPPSDEELVARVRDGDLEAFDLLARREGDRLYRVARNIVGNRHDAEEAVQDTFLQAWRSMHRFRGDSALSTWLHRICVNCCLMAVRRRRRVEVLPEEIVEDGMGPADAAVLRAEVAAVSEVLAKLPEEQRVALVLRDFADLSYQEVAEVTEVSLTAARSRIHRARMAVVGRLAADGPVERDRSEGEVA